MTTFEPACMTPDELAGWHAANANIFSKRGRADRPCTDCPVAFAAEMRGLDCCNGTPFTGGRYPGTPVDPEARREQMRLYSQRRRAAARVV